MGGSFLVRADVDSPPRDCPVGVTTYPVDSGVWSPSSVASRIPSAADSEPSFERGLSVSGVGVTMPPRYRPTVVVMSLVGCGVPSSSAGLHRVGTHLPSLVAYASPIPEGAWSLPRLCHWEPSSVVLGPPLP